MTPSSPSPTLRKTGVAPNAPQKPLTLQIPPVRFAERRYLVIPAGKSDSARAGPGGRRGAPAEEGRPERAAPLPRRAAWAPAPSPRPSASQSPAKLLGESHLQALGVPSSASPFGEPLHRNVITGRQEGWLPRSLPRKTHRHPIKLRCPANPRPLVPPPPSTPPIPSPLPASSPPDSGCAGRGTAPRHSSALKCSERGRRTWLAVHGTVLERKTERGVDSEDSPFFLQHSLSGQLGWERFPCGPALAFLSPPFRRRSASLTLLPAEGAVRKRAGDRSSMSAPPPPRQASPAAHLWLVWGGGAEPGRRAPRLFHVNNKSSHPRPRLVCARRLQSSARGHSPGAARGAAARIAPRVANRFAPTSHLGSRRRNPEGRAPRVSGSPRCPGAAGRRTLARRSPLRATSLSPRRRGDQKCQQF